MRNTLALGLGFALACSGVGCLQPAAQRCGNGGVCPPGLQCAAEGDQRICVLASCSNGQLDEGEACDDGNNRSGDGCPADCTAPCGDGVRDPEEQCDDGNNVDGDGCSADCAVLDGIFLVSPSAVRFEAVEGDDLPAGITVRVRLVYQGDTVRVGYPPGVTQPGWLSVAEGASTATTTERTLSVTDTTPIGDRSATVRFAINHMNSAGMDTFDLPVAYHIRPSALAVQAPPDLAFTAEADGATPPPQMLSATFNGASVAAKSWPSWATVTPPADPATSPATFTISINSTAFTPGTTLAGDLVLTTTKGILERTTTVHIRYEVVPPSELFLQAAPEQLTFAAITGGSTPPSQTVVLTFNGATSGFWSGPPWLTVRTPTVPTTSPATFTLSINDTSFAGGTTKSGDVVLTTTRPPFRQGTSIHVVYNVVPKPEIQFVAPYIGIAGRGDTVHVRGHGFLELGGPITITMGDLALDPTVPDSDTQLTVSYPPLPEGRYPVQIISAEPLAPSSGELVIVAPPVIAYQAIEAPGRRTNLVYDNERRALYAVNRLDQDIEHFAYAGGTWVAVSPHVIPLLTDIAMAPNGRSLIVVDADHLQEMSLTDGLFIPELRAVNPDPFCSSFFNQVVPADNGKIYVVFLDSCSGPNRSYLYDLLDHSLSLHSFLFNGLAAASGDGSRIYAGSTVVSDAVEIFDSLTNTSSPGLPDFPLIAISVSGNASRVILDALVYSQSLMLLGNLPVSGVALASWDSSRAFVFVEDTAGPRLEVYNLNGPLLPGALYPLLKTVALADSPNGPSGFHPPVVMTASRDDAVVFISGDARLLVVPVN